jgi:hypothetical protein
MQRLPCTQRYVCSGHVAHVHRQTLTMVHACSLCALCIAGCPLQNTRGLCKSFWQASPTVSMKKTQVRAHTAADARARAHTHTHTHDNTARTHTHTSCITAEYNCHCTFTCIHLSSLLAPLTRSACRHGTARGRSARSVLVGRPGRPRRCGKSACACVCTPIALFNICFTSLHS